MATLSKLTKEEQERIGCQVHEDYQKICAEVKETMAQLDKASKERFQKVADGLRRDKENLRRMKFSFFSWIVSNW